MSYDTVAAMPLIVIVQHGLAKYLLSNEVMQLNNNPKSFFISAATLALSAIFSNTASADTIVTDWDNVTLQAIRDTHPGPPIVARALAIVNTAMFDAWAAYDAKAVGTRLGATLRRPPGERTDANKNAAVSFAAYRALVDLFPSEQAKFDARMSTLGYNPANTSTDTSTAIGIGNVAAAALLEYRHHDGSNQLGDLSDSHAPYSDYTGYAPVNTPDAIIDPARWQPLRVSDGHGGTVVQKFIAPHWGKVAPFALTSADQFRPGPPAATSSAAFRAQADQVVQYTRHLDDRQKTIAEYWADGPSSELPPGHWVLFATFVSNRDKHTVDDDAKMFFAMTNAVLDASIVSWEAKRFYDYVRPVTAIHYLYAGQTLPYYDGQTVAAEAWQPYQASTVVTPPFAEYISGHSIFSRAAAEVLKNFTGSDAFGNQVTIPAGSSRVQPGTIPSHDVTLYWATFTEAADEAGISRRYGGIHFVQGDMVSRETGAKVGNYAWQKALNYIRDPKLNSGYNAAECLFNWAEENYANLFTPVGQFTQTSASMAYRHYSGSNSYMGVSSSDNHVYYQSPDGKRSDQGPLSSWLAKANCP